MRRGEGLEGSFQLSALSFQLSAQTNPDAVAAMRLCAGNARKVLKKAQKWHKNELFLGFVFTF
jgi:hypothetical protein